MAAWDRSVAELRDEVAALWVAFAEHDRAIDAERSERRASVPASPPAPPSPPDATRRVVPAGRTEPPSVEQQLADLDDVLSAIETATRTLEQNYSGELAEEPESGPEAERRSGVSPAGDREDPA